jgi:hypothetical protein
MKHKYDREVVWLSKTESVLNSQEQLMLIIEEIGVILVNYPIKL